MNITIIGATGMVGSRLVAEAAARGHRVVGAARRAHLLPPLEGVTPMHLDVSDRAQLDRAVGGADVALLTVRADRGRGRTLPQLTTEVLDATSRAGVRLIVIGGAGPLRSPRDPRLTVAEDPTFVPPEWRGIAAASTDQLDACERHPNGHWTYLSPPAILEPGTRTGRYRRGTTTLLVAADGTSRISAEDLAVAVSDEIEQPGGERHFTVAEARVDDAADADVLHVQETHSRYP